MKYKETLSQSTECLMVDEMLNLTDEDPVALPYNVDVYHMIYIIHMVALGHCDHPGPLMVVYSVNKPRT